MPGQHCTASCIMHRMLHRMGHVTVSECWAAHLHDQGDCCHGTTANKQVDTIQPEFVGNKSPCQHGNPKNKVVCIALDHSILRIRHADVCAHLHSALQVGTQGSAGRHSKFSRPISTHDQSAEPLHIYCIHCMTKQPDKAHINEGHHACRLLEGCNGKRHQFAASSIRAALPTVLFR